MITGGMTLKATEKRQRVVEQYAKILNRNFYSQDAKKRECCFTPYKDGKYYSDCSSSVRLAYKAAGIGLQNIGLNTVSQYGNKAGLTVSCAIKNGVPLDIAKLRIGDLLYFAGTDTSRAYADYVGHVEMIYAMKGSKVTLCGHGSGKPATRDMASYCKSRQSSKTRTKKGNKGLLKVLRFIADDGATSGPEPPALPRKLGDRLLKFGANGDDVKALQARLRELGLFGGTLGGNYLEITTAAVMAFQKKVGLTIDGEYGPDTHAALLSYGRAEDDREVVVFGGMSNVRTAPNTAGKILGVVKTGDRLPYRGETTVDGWNAVTYAGQAGWHSGKYGKVE